MGQMEIPFCVVGLEKTNSYDGGHGVRTADIGIFSFTQFLACLSLAGQCIAKSFLLQENFAALTNVPLHATALS